MNLRCGEGNLDFAPFSWPLSVVGLNVVKDLPTLVAHIARLLAENDALRKQFN